MFSATIRISLPKSSRAARLCHPITELRIIRHEPDNRFLECAFCSCCRGYLITVNTARGHFESELLSNCVHALSRAGELSELGYRSPGRRFADALITNAASHRQPAWLAKSFRMGRMGQSFLSTLFPTGLPELGRAIERMVRSPT